VTNRTPTRRNFLMAGGLLASGTAINGALGLTEAKAQVIETNKYRVVTSIDVKLPYLGTVKSRSTNEITGSNWLIGCETLDRDFADYDQYKEFIAPLGIKRLRLQGGWNRTEKVKGQYDFGWLDNIINNSVARGFKPWLQTSYGNVLYEGGGGANLGAGMPLSPVALKAYDKWVQAMVERYQTKVVDWEVWNEPNFGDNTINTPEITADFNIRTAEIIKRIQPGARISGLALGHYNQEFIDRFFAHIAKKRKFHLFDNMTYHDYVYNPDGNNLETIKTREALEKYTKKVKLRMGENGAPSAGGSGRGALWDYPWTELTQAKWNTRRMLGNLGMDIECSIFALVEMNYTHGPINRLNFKGILKSDASLRVIRPKTAYYSMQNVTSVFDDSLVRLTSVKHTHNIKSAKPSQNLVSYTTDRKLATYGYAHKTTGKQVYTFWLTESIPVDDNDLKLQVIEIANANIDQPVWVDVITGAVHEIPPENIVKEGTVTKYSGIPVYDAPILVADRSLIQFIPIAGGSAA
jgi:Beta-galactosidase